MKIEICVISAVIAIAVCAKSYTGAVSLSLYPSLEEFVQAYDESEEADIDKVVAQLILAKERKLKRINIANNAVVELQVVPGFKTIRKAIVTEDAAFAIESRSTDPECRVLCYLEAEGKRYAACTSTIGEDAEHLYCRSVRLRNDHTSIIGRCVDAKGNPFAKAKVCVDLVRTPVEVDEGWMHKPLWGRTDEKGYWRIDEIENPSYFYTLRRICDTNVVERPSSVVPPFGLEITACLERDGLELHGGVTIPNVTARDRAAAERIFAAYKRKTGKDWPKPAPMTDFPVSTNNVIYVPDIVLK